MQAQQPSFFQKLSITFQNNNQQLAFGSYAAELSFYILWSIAPIMLALANVIAILPVAESEIMYYIQMALPDEVETTILPLLENYLATSSGGVFSIGLIFSLWPASNVFNTIQRLFNTIYKAEPRQNPLFARLFAYLFTILLVIAGVAAAFVLVFGDVILGFIQETLGVQLNILSFIVQQGWLIGLIVVFSVLVLLFHFIPNVDFPVKYALPGTIFSLVGFVLVSQLFPLYLSFSGNNAGNNTIGVFVVLIIWLYFNAMVLAIGAYLNVFIYEFRERKYGDLVEEAHEDSSFNRSSNQFEEHTNQMAVLKGEVYKVKQQNSFYEDDKGVE